MKIDKIFSEAGLKVRQAQVEMVKHVKDAVLKDQKVVIEAGTGVGKTFAYLLGAYLGQKDRKEKKCIIISTNTIALQEQLVEKDLPFLKKLVNEDLSYVIAKGRGRYICHKRLANTISNADSNIDVDIETLDYLDERLEKGWSGDMDTLKKPVHYKQWQHLCNTSTTCIGKRCEFVKECAFIQARRRLRSADIVVVNHSLLLSHLSLGDGSILPEFEKSIFIIDECHHLPNKALSAFSGQLTLMGSQKWINDVDKTLNTLPGGIIRSGDLASLQESKKVLVTSLTEAQSIIHHLYLKRDVNERNDDIFRLKEVSVSLIDLAKNIKKAALEYQSTVKRAKKSLDDFVETSDIHTQDSLTKQFSALNFYNERIGNLIYVWDMLVCLSEPPVAKWIEPNRHDQVVTSGESSEKNIEKAEAPVEDYTVSVSATVAGHLLQQLFWSQIQNSVIMCSATIRSLGTFERFLTAMGLEGDTKTFYLASPFDYQKSQLLLPKLAFAPQQSADHIKESAVIIASKIEAAKKTKKGVLVLFTSLYAMRKSFELMPKKFQSSIIMQGDKSKSAMISSHKKMIDFGKPSIIFGVDSFAEGVDLPGKYLETLIIHKLPFSVPTDPIAQTRNEWLESQGKRSFFEVSLPEASLKLTQMVGRLIRDENDSGEVVILDNRLKTKGYGEMMLENLPGFTVSV
jgi:ATP-dependent DNA helicase DinG